MGGEDDSLETARQTDEVEAFLRMAATMDSPEGSFLLARHLCGGALPPKPGATLTLEARKLVETAAEQVRVRVRGRGWAAPNPNPPRS